MKKILELLGLQNNEVCTNTIIKHVYKSKENPTITNCKACGGTGERQGKCVYCGSVLYIEMNRQEIQFNYGFGIEPVSIDFKRLSNNSDIYYRK